MYQISSAFRVKNLKLLRRTALWQKKGHFCKSENPNIFPAKAGTYSKKLIPYSHRKPWIPFQAHINKIGLRVFLVIALIFIFIFTSTSQAEPIKVSLLLGDTNSKLAIEAVKIIESQFKRVKSQGMEDISVYVYPSLNIRNRDLRHLKESKLVMILTMGRNLLEDVKPEIVEVIKKGGKVYTVGGTYEDEHKKMGILLDEKIREYFRYGGVENLKNMILYALNKDFGFDVSYGEVLKLPEFGIYEYRTKKVFENFEEFLKEKYQDAGMIESRPWVGIIFYPLVLGKTEYLDAVIKKLEDEGFNVLPVYGFPIEPVIEKFFFDEKEKSRIRLIIGMGIMGTKVGLNPAVTVPLLSKLNVPFINAITLYSQSENEWRKSLVGLDIFERAFQLGGPEMVGGIQPTVIASKEKMIDKETGIDYIEEKPIPERINRLVERVKAWVNLQQKENKDKKIAIIYYNYPPGKQNIGAAYLNVFESMWEIIQRLKAEGYNIGDQEINKEQLFNNIHNFARNMGNWAQGELDRIVKTGKLILIPIDTYKRWFEELPEGLKKSVIKDWGRPEDNKVMLWTGASGTKYIVIPAVRYGNILFAPQPSRGWEQDVTKTYHDVNLSPHHQYIAFYLWLKKEFMADAIVHLGTHGTHEWLSGKEVGFTNEDPPEALIQDLPNVYLYVVDNVGEGLQAKRRGMAVIIDHMTPPFDKAGMNKELKELAALISDYHVAKEKSPVLAEAKLDEINKLANKTGIIKDLKLKEIKNEEDIEELDDYIKEISEKMTPFGLHTFGKTPDERYIRSTAEAIISMEKNLSDEERAKKIAEYEQRIIQSAQRELDSFIAALSGKYIPPGQGNDPIRNPDSLPTGKNFYAFDPTRIPSKSTYEMGVRLAKELIEGYKQRHGTYPDKLTFNLWSTETIRHEGVMESQIMYLMGIRPKWDARGKVIDIEAISRAELGRPRIDVTIVPSGLYRDLFPNLMALLDKAVSLAKEQIEDDNILRWNVLKTKKMLMEKGISEDIAERLASVRLFTTPSGAYSPNLEKVISMSNTWENERQVADVYFMRMSYMYGQGFWGDKVQSAELGIKSEEDVSLTLFKNALSGSKIAVHSRSGNVYATLDNDDFFQFLGGTAMAIRALDGKTPEVYITNLSNPKMPKQETLEKFMGREMRTRYLNPEWIKSMMKEGYAGARFIDKIIEHLWGWQVTVPEAVDAAKWNELYETYVLDKYGLNIKEMFRQSKNMWAYQSIVARMLETIRKNYWKPEKKIIETLAKEYAESVREVGLACCEHTCNNPMLTKFTASTLMSVPGLRGQVQDFLKALDQIQKTVNIGQKKDFAKGTIDKRSVTPGGNRKRVEGYEMQEISGALGGAPSASIPYLFLIGFLIFIALISWGFRRRTL